MVDVIQGKTEQPIDWVDVWNNSPEREKALETLERLNNIALSSTQDQVEDQSSFATSKWTQFKTVLNRQMIQLWRSPVKIPSSNITRYSAVLTDFAGLHLEQDDPPHFCCALQWIHVLDD